MATPFDLGVLLITPAAQSTVDSEDVLAAIGRHAAGDWGELDDEDKQSNEQALADGSRLLSAYRDRRQVKFWIITEADRSVTTVLLPEDY